ncbi:hypothetical protein B0A55_03398 [Friedmanniomyces simplex]|uniref:Uncharacterized protein n=1 Tax=Friedmanniomyces simplex TaxID=329884 RepID=A0A4U0XUQ1_9PEZI|nr:hypothetical protein B0A55_03398 [Friedmanniomyces simplex]
MAALVATYNGDLRARDWLKRGIPLPRTGPIDTRHELRKRIRALAGLWEDLCRTEDVYTTKRQADSTGVSSGRAHARKELFRPIAMPQVAAESPPPPYEDCSDPPPDYTSTEALATVQLNVSAFDGPGKDAAASNGARRSATDEIDFTSPAGIRSHANKKAKKAAKATQKDKWAGSDDEGEKPPDGDGEGGAGDGAGGDGGFGAGGDGGDPPGDGGNGAGDGGDGGDDWTAGGTTGKGRKKKKKSAWEEYEAEEAAKKAEGEAAVNVDATPVAAAVPEVADDWGAFASVGGKKKKGKKGQPEPEPIAEPVLDTIDLDASGTLDATPATATEPDPGDEWGFSSGKKRKGAKKGKNDPLPPPPPPAPENDMKFDDVSLNDDKAAPKLDLDFGLDAPAAENKSSGFSFGGGWGGGWGSGGGGGGGATGGGGGSSSWGFGGVEEQVAEIPKADESWSFGATSGGTSTKKDRKKKGGFDFDFDDLAGDAGETGAPPGDLASPAKEEPPLEPDPWSFASTNTPIPPGGKKTKKGTRKGAVEEPAVIDVPLPPPPPPVEEFKEDVKEEDSSFGGFGMSAKDRKKAKKGGKVAQTPVEEPAVVVVPEPVAEPQATPMDDFASLSVGKKDKRKKKGAFDDWPAPVEEKVVDVPPPPPPAPLEDPPPVEDSWGGFSAASSKKKKGGKRGALDDVAPPTPAVPDPIVEEKAGGDDWFGGWGGKTATDDPPADESNFLQPDAIVEPKVDEIWTTGTKKKGLKKDKVKGIVEVVDPSPGTSILLPESIQEKSAEEETSWKGVMEAELPPAPPPPGQGLDDLNFDTTGAAALVDVNETPADDFIPSSKKSKLKKGAKGVVEPPIDTKLSKTKSRESKYSPDDIVDIIDEAPTPPLPPPPPEPVVESPREEKKASKWGVGSLWGSSSSKTSSKSTKEKEREAKEAAEREAREKAEADKAAAADEQRKADEALFAAAIGEDPNEILEIIDEAPPKKSAKDSKFKAGKLSKAEGKPGKSSKKSEPKEEPIAAVVDEPAPDPIMDIMDEPAPAEAPSAAGWGFWGAGLKPSKSGKKATPAAEMSLSKEIGSPDAWANEGPELTERPKMPEVTFAEDGLKSATSPLSTRLTKDTPSTSKSKSKSSSSTIQDRIKALQGDSAGPTTAKKSPDSRKSKDRDAAPPPAPAPEPEPLTTAEAEPVIVVPPSPEERRSSKKSTSKTSSSRKDRKDLAPLDTDPVSVPPLPSTSPLPGGFPTDDFMPDMPAAPPKPSVKDKKSSKPSKTAKQSKSEAQPVIVDAPPAPETFDDLMGLDDTKLPTPPLEKPSKDDSKGHKKERPKVVRDQGSNSWGFWGATPPAKPSSKKDSRSKDGASSPVKERPAGLSRSKSARKPTDKDPAEKASKSSGSDKDIKSASKARPSSSRGQSFGAMFGLGSTPSRSKSTRIPSSRRQSNAVDDSGMMSPPPEERSRAEVSDKAAKLMGMSRSKSTRDKPKARKVPDPYAIDSDDMIMVDGPEDSAKDMPPAEKPSTGKDRSRRSKRESTMMSGGLGGADDAVMVDAPRDEAKIDDLAFDVRPPLVRRATTSAKKPGLMGGILGAFSSRPAAPDRRQSKAYDSEDGMSRRKRGSVYDDDRSKRLRRDDRKVNRARKPSDADGLTDGAPLTEAEDPEAREARRAERRARRDREAAEDEARAARRAEREEARKAKAREEEDRLRQEDEEREARKKEERRAKRAERETRRAEEDRLAREEEAQAAERRERRRERERQRTETEPAPRPTTSDRRRSYAAERPEDEEARRVRREDRRLRRSVDPSAVAATDKERPRTSRRRSDYPAPVDDYFDKRNGEPAPPAQNPNGGDEPDADGRPYIKAGGDKTTSWVHSVNESPPPPPPVEGTIVDAPAHFAADDGVPALHPFEETTATTAREMRHKRAKERDGYGEEPERRRRSRRDRDGEGIKSSSGGSGQDRQQSYYGGPVNSIGFNEMGGVKSWDGRPAVQRSESKRGSWFKKIAGGL